MIAVTGSTGHLGRLVIDQLLSKVPAKQVVALARNPDKARDLVDRGVQVRQADYEQASTLDAALKGVKTLVLISASEVGKRERQHAAIINAAKKAGVELIAYTSILHCNTATQSLATEHRATEGLLKASGIPHVLLRNGWYFENYTENLGPALQHGAILGAAQNGRIAAASRADFAAAAVAVATSPGHAGKVYELAGDTAFTMSELAAEVSRHAGKPVAYADMPPAKYAETLRSFGVPGPMAEALASADAAIVKGELDDRSGDLHRLIGRATTTLAQAVSVAVRRA